MRQDRSSRRVVRMLTRIMGKLTAASFVARTLILGLLTLVISGAAHAVAQPAREDKDTVDMVESIVAGRARLDQVPTKFADDMGYTPVSTAGTLRNPYGGCSTPGKMGPDSFAAACQTHDLGYDLLRYAEAEGARLRGRARLELDWRLYLDLLQTCETAACSVTATAFYGAVSANSIRQGYKTPRAEPTTPWMALVVGVIGVSAAGGLPSIKTRFQGIPPSGIGESGAHTRYLLRALTEPGDRTWSGQ